MRKINILTKQTLFKQALFGGTMLGKNKLQAISTKRKDLSRMESFRSYIGKKVISKSGNLVGRVYDILFAGSSVAGIIVLRKLSKIFIGKEFFNSSGGAVMLSIDPITTLIGKQVFDADGKRIGKVTRLVRKGSTNVLDGLVVKRNLYSKPIKIPKEDIEVSKKNIILKKVY